MHNLAQLPLFVHNLDMSEVIRFSLIVLRDSVFSNDLYLTVYVHYNDGAASVQVK